MSFDRERWSRERLSMMLNEGEPVEAIWKPSRVFPDIQEVYLGWVMVLALPLREGGLP